MAYERGHAAGVAVGEALHVVELLAPVLALALVGRAPEVLAANHELLAALGQEARAPVDPELVEGRLHGLGSRQPEARGLGAMARREPAEHPLEASGSG